MHTFTCRKATAIEKAASFVVDGKKLRFPKKYLENEETFERGLKALAKYDLLSAYRYHMKCLCFDLIQESDRFHHSVACSARFENINSPMDGCHAHYMQECVEGCVFMSCDKCHKNFNVLMTCRNEKCLSRLCKGCINSVKGNCTECGTTFEMPKVIINVDDLTPMVKSEHGQSIEKRLNSSRPIELNRTNPNPSICRIQMKFLFFGGVVDKKRIAVFELHQEDADLLKNMYERVERGYTHCPCRSWSREPPIGNRLSFRVSSSLEGIIENVGCKTISCLLGLSQWNYCLRWSKNGSTHCHGLRFVIQQNSYQLECVKVERIDESKFYQDQE